MCQQTARKTAARTPTRPRRRFGQTPSIVLDVPTYSGRPNRPCPASALFGSLCRSPTARPSSLGRRVAAVAALMVQADHAVQSAGLLARDREPVTTCHGCGSFTRTENPQPALFAPTFTQNRWLSDPQGAGVREARFPDLSRGAASASNGLAQVSSEFPCTQKSHPQLSPRLAREPVTTRRPIPAFSQGTSHSVNSVARSRCVTVTIAETVTKYLGMGKAVALLGWVPHTPSVGHDYSTD